jgi:hypothetical protein
MVPYAIGRVVACNAQQDYYGMVVLLDLSTDTTQTRKEQQQKRTVGASRSFAFVAGVVV